MVHITPLKQRSIIKFCVDRRKTVMETKEMLESTGNAMIISLIDIIDLQVTQTVLDDVTNLGDEGKTIDKKQNTVFLTS